MFSFYFVIVELFIHSQRDCGAGSGFKLGAEQRSDLDYGILSVCKQWGQQVLDPTDISVFSLDIVSVGKVPASYELLNVCEGPLMCRIPWSSLSLPSFIGTYCGDLKAVDCVCVLDLFILI